MTCEIAINVKKKGWWTHAEHSLNDDKCIRLLLTYIRLRLDVNIVQSTSAMILTLTLTNEQHPPLIHHCHGKDLILIEREVQILMVRLVHIMDNNNRRVYAPKHVPSLCSMGMSSVVNLNL